ncbi:MAG: tryptophan synthase subunit alpha [Nitrospirae bacterium]|nr:tryptophan synthase subunit alpha [Nitrospirota bacterium]
MKSRISRKFELLRKENRKAFIAYIMAGDPGIQRTKEMVRILEDCGVDIIELGVPFSDPLADGPTIQAAAQRALEAGTTLHTVIDLVAELRKTTQIPIILMTYYNPIFKYGEEQFVEDASSAGVDGIIVPDLPPDEAEGMMKLAKKRPFDLIFLLAPTSTDDRIAKVGQASRGFIYYVSITGITGSKLSLDPAIESHMNRIRSASDTPVAVGFGIATPDEASLVARFADGVIIGSAIVKRINESDETLKKYLLSLRESI